VRAGSGCKLSVPRQRKLRASARTVQQCLVVVAGSLFPRSGRVVALLLTKLPELIELLLLVVRKMGQVTRGVLHRLDSLEIRHDRGNVFLQGRISV
jgi:hypothetical protein